MTRTPSADEIDLTVVAHDLPRDPFPSLVQHGTAAGVEPIGSATPYPSALAALRRPHVAKRIIDVVGAALLLVGASPLLLLAAIAIKATSRGPVLFRQRRLGLHGTEFSIMKLRTMYDGAEARRVELLACNEQDGGGVLFKIRRDPRVTPVGRWLRMFSIDELPQLLHVLSGTMSLVGPRPLAAADSSYSGPARRRLLVRPGITGLWQISGRSDLSWEDAVRLDLHYVENWGVGLDLSILFRTLVAVLKRRGAY